MTWKRRIDIGGAIVLLVLLGPVLGLAALAILATMGSPILLCERRVGLGGGGFSLLSFRTMDPRPCPNWPDELRVTPVGRLLRATRVNRLPQLVNVLYGDMSLVGPRPLPPEELDNGPAARRRQEVRPGITGLEQVSGGLGLSWSERRELDVWYVDHLTPELDLRIVWRALAMMAHARGAASYQLDNTASPDRADPLGERPTRAAGASLRS